MILPFKCNVCHADFDETGGGICSRCRMPVCRNDMVLVGFDPKKDERPPGEDCLVCRLCLKTGETFIKFEAKYLGRWGLFF